MYTKGAGDKGHRYRKREGHGRLIARIHKQQESKIKKTQNKTICNGPPPTKMNQYRKH